MAFIENIKFDNKVARKRGDNLFKRPTEERFCHNKGQDKSKEDKILVCASEY